MGALSCIPRPLRSMYVHAYQSFLWNAAATHRIQTYGATEAVEGDLVHDEGADQERAEEAVEEEEEEAVEREQPLKVKVVTSADVVSGKYSIEDVVLPLPARSSLYPTHATHHTYHSLAAADGVDLRTCTHNVKDYSVEALKGAYRKVLVKPKDMKWCVGRKGGCAGCGANAGGWGVCRELVRYADVTIPLVETDLDRIKAAGSSRWPPGNLPPPPPGPPPPAPSACDGETAASVLAESATADTGGQGQHLALKLEFTLPSSCYATMAIRELLKAPSAVRMKGRKAE